MAKGSIPQFHSPTPQPGLVARWVYDEDKEHKYIPAIYYEGKLIWQENTWKGYLDPTDAMMAAEVVLRGALGAMFANFAHPPNEFDE